MISTKLNHFAVCLKIQKFATTKPIYLIPDCNSFKFSRNSQSGHSGFFTIGKSDQSLRSDKNIMIFFSVV